MIETLFQIKKGLGARERAGEQGSSGAGERGGV